MFKYSDEPKFNLVKVKDKSYSTIIEFKDFIGENTNSFIRFLGNTKYTVKNSRIVLKEVTKKFQFIQPTNVHNSIF